jgi:hypothetical protein
LANWLIGDSPRRSTRQAARCLRRRRANDKRCRDCEIRATCPDFIEADADGFEKPDFCAFASECDVSDNSLVLVDYANGARLSYMECHFTPEYTREFMFVGDKGKLEAFYDNEQNFKIKLWKRFEKNRASFIPASPPAGMAAAIPGSSTNSTGVCRLANRP